MAFESFNSFYPDYYSYYDLFIMFRCFSSQELGIIFLWNLFKCFPVSHIKSNT
jgi:hypothetical protein